MIPVAISIKVDVDNSAAQRDLLAQALSALLYFCDKQRKRGRRESREERRARALLVEPGSPRSSSSATARDALGKVP